MSKHFDINEKSSKSIKNDIHVVVGIDFGTTYSGFTYSHVREKQSPTSNDSWHGEVGQLKTNTVLQYDEKYRNVELWGMPALAKRPNRRNRNKNDKNNNKPVELFKLHLGDLLETHKPKLQIDYKRAITDYLREFGKVIKETVAKHWPKIDFYKNVLLIFTVPAEYSESKKAIMRECIYNANLLQYKGSTNLQFTTEPEAAAVYCIKNLKEQFLTKPGTNFMVVDCGGGTVDLTTRKLLNEEQLGEVTERSGDFCGSTFIDAEFIKYLREKLGDEPMDLLRDNNYGQMQYMIQQFCQFGKIPFTGEDPNYIYELDIQNTVPILKQYITEASVRKTLEDVDWVIEIDFKSMKSIFEPVIGKIVGMIKSQLDNSKETCSAMFLVGGFSESKYLQKRIKQEFYKRVNNISLPTQPITAMARGAVIYGLSIRGNLRNDNSKCVISSRVLKYTYGTDVTYKWENGDPGKRKTHDGYIDKFKCLARRGTEMNINQEITSSYLPLYPMQTKMIFNIYYTQEYNPKYCDEPDMKLLGTLTIDLPGSGLDRLVSFGLAFGQMEIIATAKNKITGQNYKTDFKLDVDY